MSSKKMLIIFSKTHVKSLNKATAALLIRNYNSKQKPGRPLLCNFLSSSWPHRNLTGVLRSFLYLTKVKILLKHIYLEGSPLLFKVSGSKE